MKYQAKNIKEKIKSMDDCETKRKILKDLETKDKEIKK